MRVVERSCCGVPARLSHGYSRHSFWKHPRIVHTRNRTQFPRNFSSRAVRMGSQEQWPAARVRETFLEYFKKNGHTFGMFYLIKKRFILFGVMAEMSASTFVVCCTTFRSYVAICKRWDEPVQVDFLGKCGPIIRFCSAETCCQFSKGELGISSLITSEMVIDCT